LSQNFYGVNAGVNKIDTWTSRNLGGAGPVGFRWARGALPCSGSSGLAGRSTGFGSPAFSLHVGSLLTSSPATLAASGAEKNMLSPGGVVLWYRLCQQRLELLGRGIESGQTTQGLFTQSDMSCDTILYKKTGSILIFVLCRTT
jgi:hypothetical protein